MLNRNLIFILIIFMVVKFVTLSGGQSEQGVLAIKVFDVGQGDAILIETPPGLSVLIDGGPDYEVDRYLARKNLLPVCELDILILTHPHSDHLKGLNRMLARCDIGKVIHRKVKYDSREYKRWLGNIPGSKVSQVKAGEVLTLGSAQIVVVWPPEDEGFQENINNSSVSVLLDYGDFEALFLGDLEKEASSMLSLDLLEKYIDGRLEIYKVPHHGSVDSFNPELISWLSPKMCVVSVGENKFGHPYQEGLDSMTEEGCEVRRTDLEGTIEVLIN